MKKKSQLFDKVVLVQQDRNRIKWRFNYDRNDGNADGGD